MEAVGACDIGPNFFTANNLWGQPESVVIAAMRQASMEKEEAWWLEQKSTEAYVRFTGKVITMTTKYQVFNPLTGLHTQYENEVEAKVCETIINKYKPTVCQEIVNENGDSAWTLIDIASAIKVEIL